MAKYLHLHIPKPCHENWENMDALEQGRFCHSCSKTVIDFTAMTDAQVLAFLNRNTGQMCGRFLGEQLNNEIVIPSKKIPWLKYFFTITFPAFLLTLKARAQSAVAVDPVKVEQTQAMSPVTQGKLLTYRVLSGRITDPTGRPIPFASVVTNENMGVMCDADGYYSIKLSPLAKELTFSSQSYIPFTIKIPESTNTLTLSLELSPSVLGEFIIVRPKRKKKNIEKLIVAATDSVKEMSFTVYPNPSRANARLTIRFAQPLTSDFIAQVLDNNGSLLQTQKMQFKNSAESSFVLETLIRGNYVLRMTNTKRKGNAVQLQVQ